MRNSGGIGLLNDLDNTGERSLFADCFRILSAFDQSCPVRFCGNDIFISQTRYTFSDLITAFADKAVQAVYAQID